MGMGTHLVLCTRHSVFHRKQHLRDDVYQDGRTERRNGLVHKPALSAWTIKPFWSPFVDIIKTKRWWTLSMQILMSVAFILLTLSIPRPDEATMASREQPHQHVQHHADAVHHHAFASATHDIAADGLLHAGTETE